MKYSYYMNTVNRYTVATRTYHKTGDRAGPRKRRLEIGRQDIRPDHHVVINHEVVAVLVNVYPTSIVLRCDVIPEYQVLHV